MFKVIYEVKYKGARHQHESDRLDSYKLALLECKNFMTEINENDSIVIDKAKVVMIDRVKCNFIELAYIEYVGAGLVDVFENKRYIQYINTNNIL